MGGRVKKTVFATKKKNPNPGHLVRWNYISNAHTALMLLSHQHIAQAEMVYVRVCVNEPAHVCVWVITTSTQSEVLTLKSLPKSKSPLTHIERWFAPELNSVKRLAHNGACEVSVPINACSNCPKREKIDIKRTGGG